MNNDGVTKDLGALKMHRGMDLYIKGRGWGAIQDLLLLPPTPQPMLLTTSLANGT